MINAAVRGFTFAYILAAVVLLGILAAGGISAFLQLGTPVPSQKIANRNLLQQAAKALIAVSSDADNDGIIEAPAYISVTPSPVGGGGIPPTSAAPKNDAYGTPFGYCSWDNGSATSSVNRSPGSNPALQTSAVFAVISAGPDHIFQTSCATAQSGSTSGDDEVRMVTLSEINKGAGANIYLDEAVPDVQTLINFGYDSVMPTEAPGAIRYVKSNNNLYQWHFDPTVVDGAWQNISYNDHNPGKNKLINGNFDIWQRTNGSGVAVPANGVTTYVADRWASNIDPNGVSSTITQYAIPMTDNSRPPGAVYALQIPVDQSDGWLDLFQYIEGVTQFDRKTVTVSFWARTLSGTVQVNPYLVMVFDNSGSSWTLTNNTYIPITSTWQKITRTFVISPVEGGGVPDPAYNALMLDLSFNAPATGTVLISQVQLEDGPQATSFDFRPPAYELLLCQRYYERFDQGNQGNENSIYFSANGQVLPRSVQFRVPKRESPTVILTSCVSATNINGTTCTNVNAAANVEGFIVNVKSATASPPVMGDLSFNWTADAEFY